MRTEEKMRFKTRPNFPHPHYSFVAFLIRTTPPPPKY